MTTDHNAPNSLGSLYWLQITMPLIVSVRILLGTVFSMRRLSVRLPKVCGFLRTLGLPPRSINWLSRNIQRILSYHSINLFISVLPPRFNERFILLLVCMLTVVVRGEVDFSEERLQELTLLSTVSRFWYLIRNTVHNIYVYIDFSRCFLW